MVPHVLPYICSISSQSNNQLDATTIFALLYADMGDATSQAISTIDPKSVVPRETGVSGAQVTAPVANSLSTQTPVSDPPADAEHLGAVLGDHIQAGSPTTMAFAVAAFRDAHASRELLREQLDRTSTDRDQARENYHEEAKKAAVLEAKLDLVTEFKRFQSWAFGLGGVIAGAGLGSAVQAGALTWAYGLLIICGAAVMWIGAPLSSKEN